MTGRAVRQIAMLTMKRIALLVFCTIAGFSAPACADVRVSFDFFHESLAPYGEWVRVGDYGPVWHPADVDEDWAPYTDGYWAYTDGGWTWVSYEDWGGITYHYGRWTRVGGMGWCWVPGYEWGPAWVSWRKSDDYIGWAPLPPEAQWRRHTGFSTWVDVEFGIGPGVFRFCRARDFGAPVIRGVCLPPARNVTIINQTVNITNITYRNDCGHAFNGGPDYNWIAPQARQPVPRLKLVQNTTNVFVKGNQGNVFINSQRGNTLVVGAPPAARDAETAAPRLAGIRRSIPSPDIDRGWAGLKHDPARESIAAKFREETRGLTSKTAPARAFNPEQVAMVPRKADPTAKPAVLVRAPAAPGAPVAPPADVPPRPAPSIAARAAEPPQPAAAADSQGNSNSIKPPRPGIVPQPEAPVTKTIPAVPKPALPSVTDAKPHPVAQPQPIRPRLDPAGTLGRAQTFPPGRSQSETSEKILEQQRIAGAAQRTQAALDEQRKQQAAMEREQRMAANATAVRRQEEATRQATMEQQRAAVAAQHKRDMQRQEASEAARRQVVAPTAPAPQPIRRPVDVPRQVEVPRQQTFVPRAPQPAPAVAAPVQKYSPPAEAQRQVERRPVAPAAPQPAPVIRTPVQNFSPSVHAPRQLERGPVARSGPPVPQVPRTFRGRGDDERK
jgi:hypothetical protein